MATATETSCDQEIGVTAGEIWHTLDDLGPLTIAKLAKQIDVHREVVLMAVGWLAREGKVDIEEGSRSRTVSLR